MKFLTRAVNIFHHLAEVYITVFHRFSVCLAVNISFQDERKRRTALVEEEDCHSVLPVPDPWSVVCGIRSHPVTKLTWKVRPTRTRSDLPGRQGLNIHQGSEYHQMGHSYEKRQTSNFCEPVPYFFTESAHWADSVIELRCPSVCLFVCLSVCLCHRVQFFWRGLLHIITSTPLELGT